jgi:hypothetical protein
MLRTILAGITVILWCSLQSCAGGKAVAEGETFEAVEELRENASMVVDTSYTDGFRIIVPQGSQLRVVAVSRSLNKFFEVIAISTPTSKTIGDAEIELVPAEIRSRPNYKGYRFTLPLSYIGTKIIKLADRK